MSPTPLQVLASQATQYKGTCLGPWLFDFLTALVKLCPAWALKTIFEDHLVPVGALTLTVGLPGDYSYLLAIWALPLPCHSFHSFPTSLTTPLPSPCPVHLLHQLLDHHSGDLGADLSTFD